MGTGLQRLAAWIGRPLRVQEQAALVGEGRAKAIVVLGAPLDARDQLTEVGRERARAAAGLWKRGGAEVVIPTGGITRGEVKSEAAALADELVALGVPRSAILLEEQARTTAQNARCCAALLREREASAAVSGEVAREELDEHGEADRERERDGERERSRDRGAARGAKLDEGEADRERDRSRERERERERSRERDRSRAVPALGPVWLVTQPFHTRRARLCFRRAGVEAWVWPMEDSLEHRDPRRALRWSLREYLAWAKALVVR